MSIFRKNKKKEEQVEENKVETTDAFNNQKESNVSQTTSDNANQDVTLNSTSNNRVHITIEQEGNTSTVDKDELRKKRVTLTVKLILILTALFFFCWTIYAFILLFINNGKGDNANSYILLDGKSFSQTQNIMESFGKNDTTKSKKKKISDYYMLGSQLFVSENNINPSTITTVENFALFNVSNNTPLSYNAKNDVSSNMYSIDLNMIEEGDYLLYKYDASYDTTNYSNADYYPYSINSDDNIFYEMYTLPNKNGRRNKYTIKNNSSSPYLVISSFNAGSVLPSNYYDAVFYNAYYDSNLNEREDDNEFIDRVSKLTDEINENNNHIFNFKVCSSIHEAKNFSSSIFIAITDEENITRCSSYLKGYYPNFENRVLEEGQLLGYDKDPDIRENSGLLSKSSQNYKGVIGNSIFSLENNRFGKEAFVISENKLSDVYKEILLRKGE